MEDTEKATIVKSGTWSYDGSITYEVWLVLQNFDYYYDEGYEDGPPDLNAEGEVFQVVVARDGEVMSVGQAFHSITSAVGNAHEVIPQGIEWDDHRLQPLYGGSAYLLSERE